MKFVLSSVLLFFIALSTPLAWGEMREVKVGIFTTDPARIMDEGKVMDYLSRKMGVKFILIPMIGYEKSVEKLKSREVDAGVLGSGPAYIAMSKGIVELMARPEIKKSSVYYGYWLTLKGNGLNKIEDFKGKSFAYVDPYTSAGYLFPRSAIKAKGLNPDRFFGTVKFSNTHEAAIQMLLNGSVDGCAAKDTAYKKFIDTNIELKDRLNIIEVAGPFPERTLAISKRVDPVIRKKVKEVLLKMDSDPEGKKVLEETGRSRYVDSTQSDFSAISKILNILGPGSHN